MAQSYGGWPTIGTVLRQRVAHETVSQMWADVRDWDTPGSGYFQGIHHMMSNGAKAQLLHRVDGLLPMSQG